MSKPSKLKPKLGDTVRILIEGPVTALWEDTFKIGSGAAIHHVKFDMSFETHIVSAEILERPLGPGDPVDVYLSDDAAPTYTGTIVAILGDEAWVNEGTDEKPDCFTRKLKKLTRRKP